MPQRLATHAVEEATFGIRCVFKDENDNALTPQSMTWTLTDRDGTVINSRDGIAVVNPSSTQTITLSGEDLALQGTSDSRLRRLLVEITFNSNLGNELPLKDSAEFEIDDLIHVS